MDPLDTLPLPGTLFLLKTDVLTIVFQVSQAELASLISSMGHVESMAAGGIKLGGEKFM